MNMAGFFPLHPLSPPVVHRDRPRAVRKCSRPTIPPFTWIDSCQILLHHSNSSLSICASSALFLKQAMIGTGLAPQHLLPTSDRYRGYPTKRPWLWLLAAHAKKLSSGRFNGAAWIISRCVVRVLGTVAGQSLMVFVNLCQDLPCSRRCRRRSR